MKKLIKIWALSLAFIASLIILNHTNAAGNGQVSFTITGGTVNAACTYGTSWVLGTYNASLSTFDATWAIWSFVCTDTQWLSGRHMDLLSDNGVSNGTTSIAATSVYMSGTLNTATAGCTVGTNTTSDAAINTAGTIMKKNWGLWQVCTITTTSVRLRVAVPAAATVWSYTGSLTITLPW